MASLGALNDNTFLHCNSVPLCLQCVLKLPLDRLCSLFAKYFQLLHCDYCRRSLKPIPKCFVSYHHLHIRTAHPKYFSCTSAQEKYSICHCL